MAKQKGLLGVQKSQMFFSIGGEDWPSEDDSDSDYEKAAASVSKNGHGLASDSKKKKQPKNSTKRKRKEKAAVGSGNQGLSKTKKRRIQDKDDRNSGTGASTSKQAEAETNSEKSIQVLPSEIVVHILKYVVEDGGAIPTLCRLARLCRSWREACTHPSLWKTVDLSYGWATNKVDTLRWLSANRFTQVQVVNLSSWTRLANSTVQVLAENCPTLETVSLFRCVKLTSEAVKALVDKCPQLSSLDLSYTMNDMVSPSTLKYIAEKCGGRLKHLTISGNTVVGFLQSLKHLMDNCPNLRGLDFSGCKFTTDSIRFNIEDCQDAWPHLQILRMACCKIYASDVSAVRKATSPGFPELQEFSAAAEPHEINGLFVSGAGITNDFLQRVLKTSYDLKVLDIRNCARIEPASLLPQDIPPTRLEHLYISQCSITKTDYVGHTNYFGQMMKKWRHSLRDLDLAWNTYPSVDDLEKAMKKLSAHPDQSELKTLDLRGTAIEVGAVKSLLTGCPQLEQLNLASCRGLPRGIKRLHEGKSLLQLRKDIKKM
ncbi:F-box/LRR-repeat protein 6-like [Ptychodera flava]|uniref:F-box/LRR-repeat protein 6-like n=1 Tax=Ptychodera flava TaxID=63121 RepID=UPI003969C6CF